MNDCLTPLKIAQRLSGNNEKVVEMLQKAMSHPGSFIDSEAEDNSNDSDNSDVEDNSNERDTGTENYQHINSSENSNIEVTSNDSYSGNDGGNDSELTALKTSKAKPSKKRITVANPPRKKKRNESPAFEDETT
jgi:hypothetical protein